MKWRLLLIPALVLVVGIGHEIKSTPQLNQSGGAGGTTNINQFGGTNVTLGQKAMSASMPVTVASDQGAVSVSGTFWQATQPVSGTVSAAESGTWNVGINAALPAGSNVVGSVKLIPTTGCGATYFEQAIAVLPTSSTSITGTTTCISSMYFVNITGSAATVTITDGQGTPVTIVATFSIPPNSDVMRAFPYGLKAVTGIKWSAGTASAVNGAVTGWQ